MSTNDIPQDAATRNELRDLAPLLKCSGAALTEAACNLTRAQDAFRVMLTALEAVA